MIEVSSPLLSLAAVGAIQLLAVMSPGPAFIMVSRASATQSRAHGLAAGLGVAMAAVLWALAASLGLDVLLERAPWLYRAMQAAGGLYLIWIGVQSWRQASTPLAAVGDENAPRSLFEAWAEGFKSSLANPKIIVFFGSIFVTLFAAGTPSWLRLAAVGVVAVNEVLWYGFVAVVFSVKPVQNAYRRAKTSIDRVMGALIGFFGVKLVASALSR